MVLIFEGISFTPPAQNVFLKLKSLIKQKIAGCRTITTEIVGQSMRCKMALRT